ncbi:MAG TPA: hypothetical protein VGI89_02430 [Rhizomicrobium sp.]|jgi:hypothetical protein
MRYFFDVIDTGGKTQDVEGQVLNGFDAMRLEAKRALAEIVSEEAFPADDLSLSLRVRDETNVEVYNLCLQVKGSRPSNI